VTLAPLWWAAPLAILVAGCGLSWLIETRAGGGSDDPLPAFVLMVTIVAALGVFLALVL
jgi:hypothetical protein